MFHSLNKNQVLGKLHARESGLTDIEVENRRSRYGFNEIKNKKEFSAWLILGRQFANLMIWLLFFAMGVSFYLGEFLDVGVIGAIIVLNILFGFFQEYRAGKIAIGLENFLEPSVTVLRDNQKKIILARELTTGDVVFLESGNIVPADCYILHSQNLQVDESRLTGESLGVTKKENILPEDTSLTERTNLLFASSVVLSGVAVVIVLAIGKEMEIGKILKTGREQGRKNIPLEQKIKKLGGQIALFVFLLTLLIFVVGLIFGLGFSKMFYVAISLAVAAVPEGLPSVVTLTLAIGSVKLMKKGLLIKRLSSVETLGETTIIASDKTGTLTENRMIVQKVFFANSEYNINNLQSADLQMVKKASALCNNAWFSNGQYFGDQMEVALLKFADFSIAGYSRISETPFSSETKMMSVVVRQNNNEEVFTKGAPEVVWEQCQNILKNGKIEKKTESDIEIFNKTLSIWTEQSLRVIALAQQEKNKNVFLGMIGFLDPPRQDSAVAINACREAGIDFFMLTGDHEATALAIAERVHISGRSLNGAKLSKMSDQQIEAEISRGAHIFARVLPEHKSKILDILQKRGEIVAMTGDGVNDVPALRKANLGVAVNDSVDFAKASAEAIITDGGLNSIVEAVSVGRQIFNNIRKFLLFLLSGNLAELLIVFLSVIFTAGLPLLPVQILWINLVTDGLPALALGVEPVGVGVMKRKPNRPDENLLTKSNYAQIFLFGSVMAILSFAVFAYYYFDRAYAMTMTFNCLVILQIFNLFNVRTSHPLVFKRLFHNKYLTGAIIITVILQLIIIYTPINKFLHLVPIAWQDWLVVLLCGLIVLLVGEVYKKILKK
ncbi:MAG: cation-transporting P-type ATPase [Patescibacteria group bacterium]